jgi:cell fate regulator YaaT (PSP1 superfamily)
MSISPNIVGIRFQRVGKIYHFDATPLQDLRIGDQVVVETSRGLQLGEVTEFVANPAPPPEGSWKSIHHIATPRDLVLRQLLQKKELEAMINCRAKLAEQKTPGVKIVGAEYTFDGSRLSFLYSTEAEGKIELRDLRNAMQRIYPRTRVEMRQVGPRDVAKMLGGMGACGIDSRCCSRFLTDFSPISIKMAKEQGISLTPSEITGMCGRLRCCLIYEYEQYVEARKNLPKRGKRVETPKGEGKVLDVYPLRQGVVVLLDTGIQQEFPHDQLQPWDELEALRRKSQEPCGEHENGGCTCGKDKAAAAEPAIPEPPRPEAPPPMAPPRMAAPSYKKKKKRRGPRDAGRGFPGNPHSND